MRLSILETRLSSTPVTPYFTHCQLKEWLYSLISRPTLILQAFTVLPPIHTKTTLMSLLQENTDLVLHSSSFFLSFFSFLLLVYRPSEAHWAPRAICCGVFSVPSVCTKRHHSCYNFNRGRYRFCFLGLVDFLFLFIFYFFFFGGELFVYFTLI